MKSPAPREFSAKIYKTGINPCVDVPQRVSQAFDRRGYIPAKGTLNGFPIRATLVPVGNGLHRLYINSAMRKQAKVNVGDRIRLSIEIDVQPRIIPIPESFAKALENNKEAKAIYEKLPPSHQNEILAYMNSLKKPDTLERSVKKTIAYLLKQRENLKKKQDFCDFG